jgi:uncharacterized protein YbjT (DUF2867 family)
MNIVLGASGHVGSATARALLRRQEPVTAVLHSSEHVERWETAGAETAIVDVLDTRDLRDVLRRGERLFLLNPPAAPSTDTDATERQTLSSLLDALTGSGLRTIVAESTYGARPGRAIGDLGVLHEMETALAGQPIPAKILRAAFYFTNWAPSLPVVQKDGKLPSFFPADFVLPMVAPDDVGEVAAELLLAEPGRELVFVEGPARSTPADVAAAFAEALGKPVTLDVIPRDQWLTTLATMGFSAPAARSFAGMTAAAMEPYEIPADVRRGRIGLDEFARELLAER